MQRSRERWPWRWGGERKVVSIHAAEDFHFDFRPLTIMDSSRYLQSHDHLSKAHCVLSLLFLRGTEKASEILSHLKDRRAFDFLLFVVPSRKEGETMLRENSLEIEAFKNVAVMSRLSDDGEDNCNKFVYYTHLMHGLESITEINFWIPDRGKSHLHYTVETTRMCNLFACLSRLSPPVQHIREPDLLP